ncbi:MAG: alpha/beta hydrolase family protein [Balneolaceae bacterium]
MKRSLSIFCLLFFLAVTNVHAQLGIVDNSQTVESQILDREMPYSVYLPDSYESSTRSYPVLYLLHGMTDNYNGWINTGEVRRIAGKAMENGAAPEMIIIMPDGLYDAFYINNYDKSIRWEDFFYEEFIPEIEEKYRIQANRNSRAISGLSMGGYGAMYHGVKHREMFKAVYAMSAAFLEVEPLREGEEKSEWNQRFHLKTWGPDNEEGLPENFKEHSVQEMFMKMDPVENGGGFSPGADGEAPLPQIFIDCGDDDFLLEENTNLVHIMNSKNIPFEFRVRDGGHTWEYWRTSLENAMVVIGEAFRN